MVKFKVGDIVIGNEKNSYGITAKGVKCEVVKVYKNGYIEVKVPYIKDTYKVRPERFDLVSEAKITIARHGNKVVAKYGNKVGVAKCSPADEFDFKTGAEIAFCRLMGIAIEGLDDDFDWKKFKSGALYVKCTEDTYESFISEAKKHGCMFDDDESFNPFNMFEDMLARAVMRHDKKYVGDNNILILFKDNSLKISHIIPNGYDVVTW